MMNPIALNPIAYLIVTILDIYKWIVIAAVIVSWLTAFNVINERNNFVRTLLRILYSLTEPIFRVIRRVVRPIGGMDLSPLFVWLAIIGIEYAMLDWPPLRDLGW